MNTKQYTSELYNNFQYAYDFFNEKLFDGELSEQCLITLQRKNNAFGYYKRNAFTNSENENIAEIALNPDGFTRIIEEILSTLVHEQAHLLCDVKGYTSKKGHHSKQWCQIMIEQCGLQPINKNGEDVNDGAAKLSHRIVEGDCFDLACKKLLEEITFDLTNIVEIKERKEKKNNKHIFVCPECGLEVVSKVDNLNLICGEDSVQLKLVDQ
jgi:hypothetical protein